MTIEPGAGEGAHANPLTPPGRFARWAPVTPDLKADPVALAHARTVVVADLITISEADGMAIDRSTITVRMVDAYPMGDDHPRKLTALIAEGAIGYRFDNLGDLIADAVRSERLASIEHAIAGVLRHFPRCGPVRRPRSLGAPSPPEGRGAGSIVGTSRRLKRRPAQVAP